MLCRTLAIALCLAPLLLIAEEKPALPPVKPPVMPASRPVLKFEQLSLADDELRREAKVFHEWADKTAQPQWHVQPYRREPASAASKYSQYLGYWLTKIKRPTSVVTERPYQSVSIMVEGPRADGVDSLNRIRITADAVPLEGWAAHIDYGVRPARDGALLRSVDIQVGLAGAPGKASFDVMSGATVLRLTYPSISISVKESPLVSYRFHSSLNATLDFERSLRTMYDSPASLRDESLARIEMLRKQAREEFEKGMSIRMYDERHATSAEPPREEFVDEKRFDPKTRKALWDETESRRAADETILRENFREIHAVVQRALPLRDLLKSPGSDD